MKKKGTGQSPECLVSSPTPAPHGEFSRKGKERRIRPKARKHFRPCPREKKAPEIEIHLWWDQPEVKFCAEKEDIFRGQKKFEKEKKRRGALEPHQRSDAGFLRNRTAKEERFPSFFSHQLKNEILRKGGKRDPPPPEPTGYRRPKRRWRKKKRIFFGKKGEFFVFLDDPFARKKKRDQRPPNCKKKTTQEGVRRPCPKNPGGRQRNATLSSNTSGAPEENIEQK